MIAEVTPLAEIHQQALRLLYQELGIVNAVRFLKQFTSGFGDYTKERAVSYRRKALESLRSCGSLK